MKQTLAIVIFGISLLFSQNGFGQTPFSSQSDRQQLPQYKDLFDQLDRKSPRKQKPPEEACPKNSRLARQQALKDVAQFARTHSLATRSTFFRHFKQVYGDCPQFVKKAYQEAAQAILVPKKLERWKR